jgi:superfamily II DNA or RNA helicase
MTTAAMGGPLARAAEPQASEAFEVLTARAQKKFGAIPGLILARHILEVTPGADWPVKREALEALIRRYASGARDALRIVSRPERGAIFGVYTTAKGRQSARPYRTVLERLEPIRASCNCPDFLKGSLGLCKHVLAVIENLARGKRRWQSALLASERTPVDFLQGLRWDPIRPLDGSADALDRVTLDKKPAFKDAPPSRPELRLQRIRELQVLLKSQRKEARNRGRAPDPALEALLELEAKRLTRSATGSVAPAEIRSALRTLKQKLYPYQREGVGRFLASTRLLLADDMGLGKTAQAIACCHVLWTARKVRKGLLIIPAALKPQWLREWQSFTDAPAAIVDGAQGERERVFRATTSGFLIINYEQLIRDFDTVRAWNADLIVLDEAQRMKNWATKTALYVKALDPPYRLVLTGTPMENRIDELASIMDWVDDFALEPKWRLAPWHTKTTDGRHEVIGVRNLDTLRARLAPSMLRRLRQEVLSQLPSRTDTRVPVEMTAEQLEEHSALDMPIATLVSVASRRPLTQPEFLRLMQLLTQQRIIANGLAQHRFQELWPEISRIDRPSESTLRGLATPKLLELRELLSQVVGQQGRKVVVFSQWLRMLKLSHWAVREILDGVGARAVFFTGEESTKRRTQNIVDFHDDPRASVFFASDAGGVGLNLQRAANCLINLDLPWNPAVLEQRIGRIYRLGQKLPIDVFNLVSEPSIEARIFGIVASKKAFFSGLFDGTTNEVAFDGASGFVSRIEKLIDPPVGPATAAPELASGEDSVDGNFDVEGREDAEPAEPHSDAQGTAEPVIASTPLPVPSPSLPSSDTVHSLFAKLAIEPTPSGGIRIEAPPEAASTLAAIFEGFAKLLQGTSRN